MKQTEHIYIAGGCLWGVQEFMRHLSGVVSTEAGRVNGSTKTTKSQYDGYAECVKVEFLPSQISLFELMHCLFEIIDPYSLNQQGQDVGEKYRTGVYSEHSKHLVKAREFIAQRDDAEKIVVEVLPLTNYIPSDDEHQDRLTRFQNDNCHIPKSVLHKYKK